MPDVAEHILKKYWGYTSFREPQKAIIDAVCNKKDTIALLPTGGGKSICFQVPTLLQDGVCIVISPLIALIQDQVENLQSKGIKAIAIPSGSKQDDLIRLFDNIRFGNYKFVYLSPERLQSRFIQEKLKQLHVSVIAIDEAHCISEWGHDFRPSYLRIQTIKEIHPNATTIALTASANTKVIQDITSHLSLDTPKIVKKSFYRKNLVYQVLPTEDKLGRTCRILKKINAPSIVYVASRNKAKKISNYLNASGFHSCFYHGGLTRLEKEIAFEKWMQEKTPIMVATNAFGMGIDKPNVRAVIHLNLPTSLENYVQEAGRGGRDGEKSFSLVLVTKADISYTKESQQHKYPSIAEIKKVYQKLYQHNQIALGEYTDTVFEFDFTEFCNTYQLPNTKTAIAIQVLNANEIIQITPNYNQKSTIQVKVASQQILKNKILSKDLKHFLQILLRMYGGVFENAVKIDEFYIAKKNNTTSWKVMAQLELLHEKEYITYSKSSKKSNLLFLHPREDAITINRISKNITRLFTQKKQKVMAVIQYIENTSVCRNMQLLTYFEEKNNLKCGTCDVCLKELKATKNIRLAIIALFQAHKELSSQEICELMDEKENDILIHLRILLAKETIGITNYNKYFLT